MGNDIGEFDEFLRKAGRTDLSTVLKKAWKGFMVGTHTIVPAQVVSYDVSTRRASVQPVLKQKFVFNPAATPIPPLAAVPMVQWMGIKGACLFLPDNLIVAGLECLLLVAERSIDLWYKSGGVIDPADERMFDLTDSIAFLGPCSQPNIPVRNGATTSLELQYGTAYIEITYAQKFVVQNGNASLKQIELDTVSMVANAVCAGSGSPLTFTSPTPSSVNDEIDNLFK